MILCICPSPAIDVTYRVAGFVPGTTTRVQAVTRRPGGKAVNVASVLHSLKIPAVLLAATGGPAGAEFRAALATSGLAADLVPDDEPTRTTVTIATDTGEASVLVEPARLGSWPALLARADALADDAEVIVVSGSMPGGAPDDAVEHLIELGRRRGRPVLVDTSGPALRRALHAGAALVKPNADELRDIAPPGAEPVAAAGALATAHDATVVASLGTDGAVLATRQATWWARPGSIVTGNPTGAGDALVAGLARGLRDGRPAPESLADAVALAAAAVRCPHAGEVDQAEYARQRETVTLQEVGDADDDR